MYLSFHDTLSSSYEITRPRTKLGRAVPCREALVQSRATSALMARLPMLALSGRIACQREITSRRSDGGPTER